MGPKLRVEAEGPLAHALQDGGEACRFLLRIGVKLHGKPRESAAGEKMEILTAGPPVDHEDVHVASH